MLSTPSRSQSAILIPSASEQSMSAVGSQVDQPEIPCSKTAAVIIDSPFHRSKQIFSSQQHAPMGQKFKKSVSTTQSSVNLAVLKTSRLRLDELSIPLSRSLGTLPINDSRTSRDTTDWLDARGVAKDQQAAIGLNPSHEEEEEEVEQESDKEKPSSLQLCASTAISLDLGVGLSRMFTDFTTLGQFDGGAVKTVGNSTDHSNAMKSVHLERTVATEMSKIVADNPASARKASVSSICAGSTISATSVSIRRHDGSTEQVLISHPIPEPLATLGGVDTLDSQIQGTQDHNQDIEKVSSSISSECLLDANHDPSWTSDTHSHDLQRSSNDGRSSLNSINDISALFSQNIASSTGSEDVIVEEFSKSATTMMLVADPSVTDLSESVMISANASILTLPQDISAGSTSSNSSTLVHSKWQDRQSVGSKDSDLYANAPVFFSKSNANFKLEDYDAALEQESADQGTTVVAKVSRVGALFSQKVKTIGQYQYNTTKRLGKGNFGIVYHGTVTETKAARAERRKYSNIGAVPVELAIKKIAKKLPGQIEKLGLVQREMRVCRLFKGKPGIVYLEEIITTNKHHYLVFEKAEGDLAEMIQLRYSKKDLKGRGKDRLAELSIDTFAFSVQEIQRLMLPVMQGVQALHRAGYSHKDIKPANILHRHGAGLLCDFGLCSQENELPNNQFFGTREYASPEARHVLNWARTCDYIRGDIYSLGAVMYELVTGVVLANNIHLRGLDYRQLRTFGGSQFRDMMQGMLNDIEKRWTIDQVVASPFWTRQYLEGERSPTSPATPMSASDGAMRF